MIIFQSSLERTNNDVGTVYVISKMHMLRRALATKKRVGQPLFAMPANKIIPNVLKQVTATTVVEPAIHQYSAISTPVLLSHDAAQRSLRFRA